ncbi:MAG: mannose-1-phosphate guanyltransferase [Verrucomicrobia bacterium]|nr:MAG: mannose-1-phosphate guanyltransferase [Verrucomicrobiota bacterium]TAE88436.1 MAG: mannose-1-phosphate guanyltransferase [Verrucomicrobiota bacterium]TAF26889.1 MAG: mannose-1-phosphate guanyltransferase [Verrucomicrobiota bacterium]TAF42147.1 MAG: mannose-1-phosphate guanyltransferase [Verrucomicrobiota bacterium]
MPDPSSTYALILAGGSGTRFWPLSRNARPKQLLNLFGDSTLLEQTLERLDGLVAPENILILTNAQQEAAVREVARVLPPENIFAEPAKRDTAPAVALGIGLIAARNPDALMIVLPADQLIQDVAAFQSTMRDALATAEKSDGLVTIGIKPTWPCPSYGYIERGPRASIPGLDSEQVPAEVKRFREKPSSELAEQFIAQGGFCWNAGMFVWSLPNVIRELSRHQAELATFVSEIRHSSNPAATVAAQFPKLTPISIDYGLMEKSSRVLNIEASFDWDDVGSWLSVAKYLEKVDGENRSNSPLSVIDSENNIVFNARKGSHVALLGVDDLIIVQTDDALLIANRHQADAIKALSDKLPPELL